MTETFESNGVVFDIGNKKTVLPADWSIVVGDPSTGDVEVIAIEEINLREFSALTVNPFGSKAHRYAEMKAIDLLFDVNWCVPRLPANSFLLVPLSTSPGSPCILIINERDQKRIPAFEISAFV